jgi:Phosphotransferase system cellobiose-specific component IIB
MIKILLCCGGGFSSSAIATRIQKDIEKNNLKEKAYIEYSPFSISLEKINDFDIMICCPHLNIYVKQLLKKQNVPIPIYVLPPKIYGNMKMEDIIMDCEDIIEMYHNGQQNPIHFPKEENVLKIKRDKAYRKVKGL